ncbi:hypothetical protein [Rubinisphaera margarita]|uniref:hypothetical protein n=1 Tax=Rubinisphaera margarita TaxID=2909586 RepID=UPI001EE8E9BF|nr:hypothetical protein [Rubinisphaera margarita]MCG6157388.1 hypothetical protein [Rubinisphaera margarita]
MLTTSAAKRICKAGNLGTQGELLMWLGGTFWWVIIFGPIVFGLIVLMLIFFLMGGGTTFLDFLSVLFNTGAKLTCWHCGQETLAERKHCRHCGKELQ